MSSQGTIDHHSPGSAVVKRLIIICFLCFFCLTSVSRAKDRGLVRVYTDNGRPLDLYRGSHALVIGNGDYTCPSWDRLPGALEDVDDVARALEGNGFTVHLHKNLTLQEFRDTLLEFSYTHGQNPENRLLLYYSGHGYTLDMANGDKLGFLVMVDAPDPDQDPVGFRRASLSMDFLVTEAKQMKSRHVLFIFDSCFSGTILNLKGHNQPEFISDLTEFPVREFITAGREDERVPDRSVFKQVFVDVLEGRMEEPIRDGYLTGEELGLLMKTNVSEYNRNQHPQFGKINDPKLDKGDFVFVLPSASGPQASSDDILTRESGIQDEMARLKTEKLQIEAEKARLADEEQRLLELERKKLEEEKKRLEDYRRELEEKGDKIMARDEKKPVLKNFFDSLPPVSANEHVRVIRVERVKDTGGVLYFYYDTAKDLSMDLNSRSATDHAMREGRRIINQAHQDHSLVAVYFLNKVSRSTGQPYELLTRIVSENHGSLHVERKYKIY